MAEVSDQDRECARRLPDEFVQMLDLPLFGASVISGLIDKRWISYPAKAKQEFAAILEPILEPLTEKDATVTDELRQQCEVALAQWIERL